MFVEDNPNASLDDIMTHFGVKGMKWGVRHDPELIGRKSGGKANASKGGSGSAAKSTLSDHDKALLAKLGFSEHDSANLNAKFGPGSLSNEPSKGHHLTPAQKKFIKNAIIVGGIAGALWYLNRQGQNMMGDMDPSLGKGKFKNLPAFTKEWKQYQKTAGAREGGYTPEMVSKLSTQAIHHPPGSIFKRVSTEMEDTIRPGGFYASPHPEDVDRYKAILPVFWKQWGKSENSGYVVNLKANVPIKAPSERETFDMFKSMLHDHVDHPLPMLGDSKTIKVRDLFHSYTEDVKSLDDESFARKFFPQFSQGWIDNNHPATSHFFSKLKDRGFNAVVDMNDAGALSKQPMRIIDGSIFSIAGHEPLSAEAIRTAQENIMSLVHRLRMMFSRNDFFTEPLRVGSMTTTHQEQLGIDFLEHYGVVGMKWGKHRAKADGYDIRAARSRVATQKTQLHKAQRDAARVKDPAAREMAKAKVGEMKTTFLKNPDRVVASRLTRGEKAVSLLLGFGAAPIVVTSIASRRIEQKQDKGAYDKK